MNQAPVSRKTLRCPIRIRIIAGMIFNLPLLGAFGDTKSVLKTYYPDIPPGWAAIGITKGPDGLTYSGNYYLNLLDLNDAPYETTVNILKTSPIPRGWVIICIENEEEEKMPQAQRHRTIINLNGAPYGAVVKIAHAHGSPVPSGWSKVAPTEAEVKSDRDNGKYCWIKCFKHH